MRTTRYWTVSAVLLAAALGCGRDSTPANKVASVEPAKTTAAPAVADHKLVTLKVEGMV